MTSRMLFINFSAWITSGMLFINFHAWMTSRRLFINSFPPPASFLCWEGGRRLGAQQTESQFMKSARHVSPAIKLCREVLAVWGRFMKSARHCLACHKIIARGLVRAPFLRTSTLAGAEHVFYMDDD